eukprot:5875506-Ditylum_brightwellii.AAC.1
MEVDNKENEDMNRAKTLREICSRRKQQKKKMKKMKRMKNKTTPKKPPMFKTRTIKEELLIRTIRQVQRALSV